MSNQIPLICTTRGIAAALLAMMLAWPIASGCSANDTGSLRVINLSQKWPVIDVGFDGERRIRELPTGDSSGYRSASVGPLDLRVVPPGSAVVILDQKTEVAAGSAHSMVLFDNGGLAAAALAADERSVVTGQGPKLRFFNAIADAPEVDLSGANGVLFGEQEEAGLTPYLTLSQQDRAFTVTDRITGQLLLALKPLALDPDKTYTLAALGTADEEDNQPVTGRLFTDSDQQDPGHNADLVEAQVMLLNASPGADGINALIDEKPITSSALKYLESSGYVPVSAGLRQLVLKVATGGGVIFEEKRVFDSGGRYTVALADDPEKIKTLFFKEDAAAPPASRALVRLIHLAPDVAPVDLKITSDISNLFSGVRFKQTSPYVPLPVGPIELDLRQADSSLLMVPTYVITLKEGTRYTLYLSGKQADSTLGLKLLTVK